MTTKRFPFQAWPEIQNRHQPLCLPTLFRAVYHDSHITSGNTSKDEADTIEQNYLKQFEEELTPEYIEYITHLRLEGGEEDSHIISKILSTAPADANMSSVGDTFLRGMISSWGEDFYGPRDAFGFVHELGHVVVQSYYLYSSNTLNNQSMRVHKLINSITTDDIVTVEEMGKRWDEFNRANTRLEVFSLKFRPLEEVVANYISLQFLPPDTRLVIEEQLMQKLKGENLYSAYCVFVDACNIGFENDQGRALEKVYNIWCAIYCMANLDVDESIMKTLQICKYEFTGNREELIDILEPRQYWAYIAAIGLDMLVAYNFNLAISRDFSDPKDRQLFPPQIILVGAKGHIIPIVISPFMNEKLANDLTQEIFLESVRQQLSHGCGLRCPYSPLPVKEGGWEKLRATMKTKSVHHPYYFYKGGRSEALWNLYRRLPEEQKHLFTPPACPSPT
jgi:hypothetical protein